MENIFIRGSKTQPRPVAKNASIQSENQSHVLAIQVRGAAIYRFVNGLCYQYTALISNLISLQHAFENLAPRVRVLSGGEPLIIGKLNGRPITFI